MRRERLQSNALSNVGQLSIYAVRNELCHCWPVHRDVVPLEPAIAVLAIGVVYVWRKGRVVMAAVEQNW